MDKINSTLIQQPNHVQEAFSEFNVLEVLEGGTTLVEHVNDSRRIIAVIYPQNGAPSGSELVTSFNKLMQHAQQKAYSTTGEPIPTHMVSYQPPGAIIPKDMSYVTSILEGIRLIVGFSKGNVSAIYTITKSQPVIKNLGMLKFGIIVAETDDIKAALDIFERIFAIGDIRLGKGLTSAHQIMNEATSGGIPTHFGHLKARALDAEE